MSDLIEVDEFLKANGLEITDDDRIWALRAINKKLSETIEQHQAEIERLQTKMCGDLAACESKKDYIDYLEKRIGHYTTRITKLEAALQKITKGHGWSAALAREALAAVQETRDD